MSGSIVDDDDDGDDNTHPPTSPTHFDRMEVARFELVGLQLYIGIACRFNNTTLSLAHGRPMVRALAAQQQV